MSEAHFLEYNLGRNADEDYSGPTHGESRVGNALCLKLNPGSKKIEYKIYAKDTNRVRFEIVYKSNLASILQLQRSRGEPNSYRSDPRVTEGLTHLLKFAKIKAHKKFTKLLRGVPQLGDDEHGDFQSFITFLTALSRSREETGTPNRLQHIISLLATNGRIVVDDTNEDERLKDFCDQLYGEGIVRKPKEAHKTRGETIYYLNTTYRRMMLEVSRRFSAPQYRNDKSAAENKNAPGSKTRYTSVRPQTKA